MLAGTFNPLADRTANTGWRGCHADTLRPVPRFAFSRLGRPRKLRATDADRDAYGNIVSKAFSEGQLDATAFEYRSSKVLIAKTVGELDDLVADLGMAGRVVFTGDRRDVYDWFDAIDVAVHASWGEAFGLVLVEAMALGTPVVATSVGGPAEIIEDGVSGLLVAPGDHRAMADAIARALDPVVAAGLGRAAAARAERFSAERMATTFASLFDEVLERGAETHPGRGRQVRR